MGKDYEIRLSCPYGDKDTWVVLEDREETLDEITRQAWDFECPVHGVQQAIPLTGRERGETAKPQVQEAESAETKAKNQKPRTSEREQLHVQVVVYGWAKSQGAFHEETTTQVVNASGGLVDLCTRLTLGETVFLINKVTREEQQARVVFVGPVVDGRTQVGLAFKKPKLDYWKMTRKSPRLNKGIRVKVKGQDRNGNAFVQTSSTLNISETGARLDGLGYLTSQGEIIEVKRRWGKKAKYRVVWVGQVGLEHANQIGICSLEENKDLWGVKIPEAAKATPEKAKAKKSDEEKEE